MGLTPHEHVIAIRLAREGYTTLALGYLGHQKRTTGAVVKNEQVRRLLEQTVIEGWRVLLEDPRADANQAAVIGFSLGGYFATFLATANIQCPPKAVVIYYGVYALERAQPAALRTPMLVLQGEDDDPEFVNNARGLKERHGDLCEIIFYPNTGHQFDLFDPNNAATKDSWARTVRFLTKKLRHDQSA
jgi:dienelactone hydrolase